MAKIDLFPSSVKNAAWNLRNTDKNTVDCYCCKSNKINMINFKPVLIEYNKKSPNFNIDNIQTICSLCYDNILKDKIGLNDFMSKFYNREEKNIKEAKANKKIPEKLLEFENNNKKTLKLLNDIYDEDTNCLVDACMYNLPKTAKYIIDSIEIDINHLNEDGTSAIMYACKNNMPEIAKLLLLNGSRITSESSLENCINNNMIEIIDMIILLKLYSKNMIKKVHLMKETPAKLYTLSKI